MIPLFAVPSFCTDGLPHPSETSVPIGRFFQIARASEMATSDGLLCMRPPSAYSCPRLKTVLKYVGAAEVAITMSRRGQSFDEGPRKRPPSAASGLG